MGDILTWYHYINPDKTVEIVNCLGEQAAKGDQVFYDIYTEEEKAADPWKEDTGLFFFRGEQGGKVAFCNAGAEIPYVFYNVSGGDDDEALASQISQAWINFAKSGIPSAEGLPEWIPYTREEGATMLLDTESKLVNHHDRELMSLLAPDYVY